MCSLDFFCLNSIRKKDLEMEIDIQGIIQQDIDLGIDHGFAYDYTTNKFEPIGDVLKSASVQLEHNKSEDISVLTQVLQRQEMPSGCKLVLEEDTGELFVLTSTASVAATHDGGSGGDDDDDDNSSSNSNSHDSRRDVNHNKTYDEDDGADLGFGTTSIHNNNTQRLLFNLSSEEGVNAAAAAESNVEASQHQQQQLELGLFFNEETVENLLSPSMATRTSRCQQNDEPVISMSMSMMRADELVVDVEQPTPPRFFLSQMSVSGVLSRLSAATANANATLPYGAGDNNNNNNNMDNNNNFVDPFTFLNDSLLHTASNWPGDSTLNSSSIVLSSAIEHHHHHHQHYHNPELIKQQYDEIKTTTANHSLYSINGNGGGGDGDGSGSETMAAAIGNEVDIDLLGGRSSNTIVNTANDGKRRQSSNEENAENYNNEDDEDDDEARVLKESIDSFDFESVKFFNSSLIFDEYNETLHAAANATVSTNAAAAAAAVAAAAAAASSVNAQPASVVESPSSVKLLLSGTPLKVTID